MRTGIHSARWVALAALAACSSSETNESVDASPALDAASTPDAAAATATLTGMVTRTASPSASGDARGHVYVALFDRDPVVHMAAAVLVARVRLDNVDLSGTGANVAYTLTDVPPRATDYFLLGFLDDNGNVDPQGTGAGPDKGDLVSLDGFASPKVKIATSGSTSKDIVLNSVLPF